MQPLPATATQKRNTVQSVALHRGQMGMTGQEHTHSEQPNGEVDVSTSPNLCSITMACIPMTSPLMWLPCHQFIKCLQRRLSQQHGSIPRHPHITLYTRYIGTSKGRCCGCCGCGVTCAASLPFCVLFHNYYTKNITVSVLQIHSSQTDLPAMLGLQVDKQHNISLPTPTP